MLADLRHQGTTIIVYPKFPTLVLTPSAEPATLTLTLSGAPGRYLICGSDDLDTWIDLGEVATETTQLSVDIANEPDLPSACFRATWLP